MKKAVFLGVDHVTANVYSPEMKEKLASELIFETGHAISQAEAEEYRDILRGAEYAFSTWGMPCFSAEEIRKYLPNLKAVFYAAGTVKKFARPFIEAGITVCSAWAANAVPVAEYTFAQICLATKGFFQRLHRQSAEDWHHKDIPVPFPGNYGVNIGVVGCGMIGRLVVEKLHTLSNINVLVFDPFLPDERAAELGVTKVSLEELFARSQVITNHLADNEATRGMMNKTHFSLMQNGAVFINTGRGAQVVEADLIEALRANNTLTAVLDVTDPEPPVADSPLYTLDNVFLTPHIAGSIGGEVHRMADYMYEEYKKFDSGEETQYSVTLKMLETMA